MRKLTTPLFAAALFAAAPAFAGDFYFHASFGSVQANASATASDAALAQSGRTGIVSSLDTADSGAKLHFGYAITPNWAIEGGFTKLGEVAYTATFTGGNRNETTATDGFSLAVRGSLPVTEKLSAYAKLGAMNARQSSWGVTKVGATTTAVDNATTESTLATYGVGIGYRLCPGINVRVEHEVFGNSEFKMTSAGFVIGF